MLKHPENIIGADAKQHRLAALDQHIITEYEGLVTEWISTIETILMDHADEKYGRSGLVLNPQHVDFFSET